jgi:hypothetical protein
MYYFLEIDYARYIYVYFKRRKIYIGIIMKTNLFRVDRVAVITAWIWNRLFILREYEICFSYCVNMKYAFLSAWIWNIFKARKFRNLLREYILFSIGPFYCYLYPVFANSLAHCNIFTAILHYEESVMPYVKYLSYP